MPRALYVTSAAVVPFATSIVALLTKRHGLSTKLAVLPATIDAKLLRSSVILRLDDAPPAVGAKKVALAYHLFVPGGVLPGKVTVAGPLKIFDQYDGDISVSPYAAAVRFITEELAPFIDAPAKRTIAVLSRNYDGVTGKLHDKAQTESFLSVLRGAGLVPLGPKPGVVDGESVFKDGDKSWRKTAWARIEIDQISDSKVCLRGESTRGISVGSLNNLYSAAFKVSAPRGEDQAKTWQRLNAILERDLLPHFGGVPEKQRRDDAAILALLGGASAASSKAAASAKPAGAKSGAKPASAKASAKPASAKTSAKPASAKPGAKPASAKPSAKKGARRFEFQGGGSHKFWTVSTTGTTLTVQFGRVGSSGQTKLKTFPSPALALAAMTKLVGEKTASGYAET